MANNPTLPLGLGEIEQSLTPENFVNIRRVIGGPSPQVVTEALARARDAQVGIERWVRSKSEGLEKSDVRAG
jgi:argininosuccinate lyase